MARPFFHLDKALGFAYNPNQEELFVAYGAPKVLVLDTSLTTVQSSTSSAPPRTTVMV